MHQIILDKAEYIQDYININRDIEIDQISYNLDKIIDEWKFVDKRKMFIEDEIDSNSPFYFYTKQNLDRLQNYVFKDEEKKFIKDFFMGIIEETLEQEQEVNP